MSMKYESKGPNYSTMDVTKALTLATTTIDETFESLSYFYDDSAIRLQLLEFVRVVRYLAVLAMAQQQEIEELKEELNREIENHEYREHGKGEWH